MAAGEVHSGNRLRTAGRCGGGALRSREREVLKVANPARVIIDLPDVELMADQEVDVPVLER